MTTTAAAIRNAMLGVVAGITPDDHSSVAFVAHREGVPFTDWAEAKPDACLRRFSIRSTGTVSPPSVTNTDVEWCETDIEVRVAYPTSGRFGGNHLTSLDDAIENDLRAIERHIGTNGYAFYAQSTAGATVTTTGTDRETSGGVTYALLHLHAGFWRTMGVADRLTVTGTNGALLKTGDVYTSNLRDVSIQNGRIRVGYPVTTPDVQRGCHRLDRYYSGAYTSTMEADQHDWSYFGVTLGSVYDRMTVIEATDETVCTAWQYDALDLTSYSGGGIINRDYAQGINYSQGAVNPNWKKHTAVKLVKVIRVNAGEDGYHVGWHTTPYIGLPQNLISSAVAEDTTYGERELGQGGGLAVCWAGNGNIARWPAWGDDVDLKWTTAGLSGTANRIWWPGIKDPRYSPYSSAAWISTQPAGYPTMQTTGPYYAAGIHYDTSGKPFVHILASRTPREIGAWLVGTYGGLVSHFNNEDQSPSGTAYETQIFIGAIEYHGDSSSAWANEPKAGIQTTVANLVAALDYGVR